MLLTVDLWGRFLIWTYFFSFAQNLFSFTSVIEIRTHNFVFWLAPFRFDAILVFFTSFRGLFYTQCCTVSA